MRYFKISGLFLILFSFISCSKNAGIFSNFDCPQTSEISTKPILDAFFKFSLDIPTTWKTELYIDNDTSIFATADTTKQLTEAFLIKVSQIPGQLTLNQATTVTIKSELTKNQWQINSIQNGLFKEFNTLLIASQKQPSHLKTSALHLYFSVANEYYFEIEIQCFGDKNIDERFCQAIKIINSLNIKE